jgi:phage tail sheath protein FI
MSASLTYPGVYIQELPSGQHSITGVATSIAVFIGWAPQGSVAAPVLVENWLEYQTLFGGWDSRGLLGYAVNQFFSNGGTQAYIIRLASSALTATGAVVAGFTLYASSPGAWGNYIVVTVTQPVQPPSPTPSVGFSLTVAQVKNGTTTLLESYSNLSLDPTSGQYVVPIINNDSNFISFIDPADVSAAITVPTTLATGTNKVTLSTGQSDTLSDGTVLDPTSTSGDFTTALIPTGSPPPQAGYLLLEQVKFFNLLCIPGYSDAGDADTLMQYCNQRRAFWIVDAPQNTTPAALAKAAAPQDVSGTQFSSQYLSNAGYYFPWVSAPDPLSGGRPKLCPPCGFVSGIYAATDASRGVWKAPAGIGAALGGLLGLQFTLSDAQNGNLNPFAINCLRSFNTYGTVVWGSRTMAGADQAGSQWKYIPIRRLALYLESSLYEGTQWVVFEPNDETLWGQIRMNVGSFMQSLFLQGAFAGSTSAQAYFVKCDGENNPDSSTALGIVNILVGFAPLYPAEFVVIQIQQMIAQTN